MAPVLYYGTDGTTAGVWQEWTTTSATTTVTYVWNQWVETTSTISYPSAPGLTVEQLEARRIEQAEREKQVLVKRERAKKLLAGALAKAQREELRKHGYFHVETKDGTRRYRLAPGSAPRRVHGEDGRQWSYCIHPDYGYPPEDVVLAQKLLLEADEEAFLRIANASAVRA